MATVVALLSSILLVTGLWSVSEGKECPRVSPPCRCGNGRYGSSLVCQGITSELELEDAIRENTRDYHPEEFYLDDSELRFITHDTFKNQTFLRVHIRNTTLLSLTNTRRAFEGLEDTLIELTVERCSFVSHWDWDYLSHLRHLTELHVTLSDLVYVSNFEQMPTQLRELKLEGNEIAGLVPNAFSHLFELRSIMLGSNEIALIERNMLPATAEQLFTLDLSHNYLPDLPEDMFSNMPALRKVHLSGNRLKTISHNVFREVWGRLHELHIKDNGMICDCRLKWILETESRPRILNAHCKMPGLFLWNEIPVHQLKRVHMRCR